MIVKIKNIVVFVRDFPAARLFYRQWLALAPGKETETMMEFFPGEGTSLGVALALHDDAQKLVGRHTGITLSVQGLDQVCARLEENGARFTEKLESTPWGKMAVVADQDGNEFALVEA
jgi:predicted enzyme related to lactoylglutathione lyase